MEEKEFYENAYMQNETRRQRGYGWEYTTSKLLKELLQRTGLQEGAGKKALDMGCGDGRHIQHLRNLGYQVTGVEFSENAHKILEDRFKNDNMVQLKQIDLTTRFDLGVEYDLIVDWSVMDHIRRKDLPTYVENIKTHLSENGSLVMVEFCKDNFPGLFKNKDYKLVNGHYSRAYAEKDMDEELGMENIHFSHSFLEDEMNGIHMNGWIYRREQR